ncbi:DUF481 domain-containing protein [Cellvibrio japonicus]|nr:DUF481 domain-containing protein [Cellvibrio japonicus]
MQESPAVISQSVIRLFSALASFPAVMLILWGIGISSPAAQAGVIELTNGDRIQGEALRIEGENLVWQSDNFGELRINKNRIKQLNSDKPHKIAGNKIACIIDGIHEEQLVYYCGARSKTRSVPVLSLKTLLPYDDYVRGVMRNTGKLNLWGAYSSGNEVRNEWNLQGETRLRKDEFRHVLAGEYAKASWNHADPRVRWSSLYSLDWFFRARWFWYNSLTLGADEQRGLARQTIFGSGTGYQFWETSKTALSQQLGLAYIDQRYEIPEDPEQLTDESASYAALRAATDFRYEFPGGIAFFHNNELLYSLEENSDWLLKTSSGLSTMILSNVYSELKVDYWIDNEPQPTKARSDTRMSVGVSYKW